MLRSTILLLLLLLFSLPGQAQSQKLELMEGTRLSYLGEWRHTLSKNGGVETLTLRMKRYPQNIFTISYTPWQRKIDKKKVHDREKAKYKKKGWAYSSQRGCFLYMDTGDKESYQARGYSSRGLFVFEGRCKKGDPREFQRGISFVHDSFAAHYLLKKKK